MLDFNEIERNIYEIVKSRFIKRINCISKAGDLDKQYGHIWTMLLRLRQLTSHVLLVQGTITDLLEREDFERLYKIASDDLSEESEALLTHLREKLKENGGTPRVDGREGATIVTETESIPNHRTGYDAGLHDVGGKHGLTYKFDRYLESLLNSESWDAIASRALCCGCRQPPLDPMVTSCFHVYCHTVFIQSDNPLPSRITLMTSTVPTRLATEFRPPCHGAPPLYGVWPVLQRRKKVPKITRKILRRLRQSHRQHRGRRAESYRTKPRQEGEAAELDKYARRRSSFNQNYSSKIADSELDRRRPNRQDHCVLAMDSDATRSWPHLSDRRLDIRKVYGPHVSRVEGQCYQELRRSSQGETNSAGIS